MTTTLAVTSDTHCEADDGSDLPKALLDALAGCDLIIHLGDLTSTGVLDRLEALAPMLAVRSFADRAEDARLPARERTLEREGVRIGLVNALEEPRLSAALTKRLGGPVDVVLFGGTHAPLIALHDGVLFVNPGSPTLPAAGRPTWARLRIEERRTEVEIVSLPPA